MKKTITCIGCPMGCQVSVTMEDGKITRVEDYICKKGKEYAVEEMTNPARMVTSVLRVEGRREPLSVKTRAFIPKAKVFDCLREIRKARITLPVQMGDIIVPNVCQTGVDVVATKSLD